MDEIIPGLWIGDLACALAPDYLALAGITHIVTALKQRLPPPPELPDGRIIPAENLLHVRLDDVDESPIICYFPTAVRFIADVLQEAWVKEGSQDDAATTSEGEQVQRPELIERVHEDGSKEKGHWETRGEGSVLVHCQAGVSRSSTLVVAYLMHTRGLNVKEALDLVKSRREGVQPNPGFMTQLELYEAAGCQVDLRHQPIRRFLMSQTSILNGDSIDDVLMSYYPSPYPSPAASAKGLGGSMHMSVLDAEDGFDLNSSSGSGPARRSRRASSTSSHGGMATASGPLRKRSTPHLSRSTSRCSVDGSMTIDLSKSPPMPQDTSALLIDDEDSRDHDEVARARAARSRMISSVADAHEVKVTLSGSHRLPGGVTRLGGVESASNRGSLPKPTYRGPKLRCKMCSRELAAWDHIIDHEEGKGLVAFEMRKRRKEVLGWSHREEEAARGLDGSKREEGESSASSVAVGQGRDVKASHGRGLSMEQRFGRATRSNEASDDASTGQAAASDAPQQAASEPSSSAPTAAPNDPPSRRPMQSAASLTASLPPHLAALRLGRAAPGQAIPPAPASPSEASPSRSSALSNGGPLTKPTVAAPTPQRRITLPSARCTSYFVEPLAWMAALKGGDIAGRLDCPNKRCGAKLGNWDWAGMQCGCGAWVTPAFALHRSKVDEV